MFNLEQSIKEWRKQMLAVGIKAPVLIEELESHLREEIDEQVKAGMDAQKAFETTVAQLGRGSELKAEFSRSRNLRDILEIELIGKEWDLKWGPVLHFILFTGVLVFCGSMVLFKRGGFSETTSLEQISRLGAIVVSYLLFNTGLLGYKFFPVIPGKYTRLAIYACCTMAVSFFVMLFLVSVNVNVHQFVTEFLWAFLVPTGAFCSLIFGLERAAQKKMKTAGS